MNPSPPSPPRRAIRRSPSRRPARSSRPILTHAQYFEEPLLQRSGRLKGRKTLTQQFLQPSRVASTRRRNATLADPWKLAFARW
jgi:hypothetical protein